MKTITITQEAFDAVKSSKEEDESYSELLLKVFKKKKTTVKDVLGFFGKADEKTIETERRKLKKIREQDSIDFEERAEKHALA